MITALTNLCIVGLYAASAGLLLRNLAQQQQRPKVALLAPAAVAALLHLWQITALGFTSGSPDFSLYHILSATSWLVATLLMLLSTRQPIENIGIAVLPITAAMAAMQFWIADPASPTPMSSGLKWHILTSITAYVLLAISAAQAALLALQNNLLHRRQAGGFMRALPPLTSMEKLLFQLIAVGFVFLSLSLITGFAFLDNMFAQRVAHKTILSLAAWSIFGVLLIGRWRQGWRGKIAVRWTLGGTALLVLGFVGSKFVMEQLLAT